ncbi:MAG: AraC family ligand binding domain-containing protein [Rhodocyclaceae bacterium]|nr:AraC family ligand binding domain-containing protein [Rhodocyclaceae bacterium]MDQ8003079.1 AraC family ligand binding domain-containing protein [Pseudomonadota bacterium]MDQ8017609.1 AraC family ligand binding domain-containing protein [Pseudomonadota bacterium]
MTSAFPEPVAEAAMPRFADFEADARARGFDEVAERTWEAGTQLGLHGHPFAVEALMVQGELALTIGDDTRVLRRGDRFALAPDQPHAERYGSEGATYWAARRHG